MDYPIPHWTFFGGGLLIGLTATIHVFISHFAVGGGFFLAVLETRAKWLREPSNEEWLRRFARFFLVLTMVAGALTGVGIWFSISIAAPGATSALIHAFVMGWATEWVFFLGEVIALICYIRASGAENTRRRVILAWLYFACAFASLVIVQGFLSFMLTPGKWLATHSFWDGFFNPTYLPGLVFRSAMCAVLAGTFALAVAQSAPGENRKKLTRFCAWWAILPMPAAVAGAWWHIAALSPSQQTLVRWLSPEVAAGQNIFIVAVLAVMAGGALLGAGLPRGLARAVSIVSLAASFVFIGSFEYMREAARRPYVITGHIFSNGIPVDRAQEINAEGILPLARWSGVKTAEADNSGEAGREIYYLECSSCHSLGGPMLDMRPHAAKYSLAGMEAWLTGQGSISTYMPPFLGTRAEKKALAVYLTKDLNGWKPDPEPTITQTETSLPAFDASAAEYVLTAVADMGINMFPDAQGKWTMGVGAQGLSVHLVKRGESPELVTEGVSVAYRMEDDRERAGGGKSGGSLTVSGQAFRADAIHISPYSTDGKFDPYPVATVTARGASGKVLAETKVVLPVSTEMGCKNCHGGPWRHEAAGVAAGVADSTAQDILRAHDRLSGTRLLRQRGPVDCRSCHKDSALSGPSVPDVTTATGGAGVTNVQSGPDATGAAENTGAIGATGTAGGAVAAASGRPLNLSAAMHGLHAVYLAGQGANACDMCHPTSPTGATRAFRDPHKEAGLDCANCHGVLEDHALSLLTGEARQGVKAAKPLMKLVKQRDHAPVARAPWINEPKCVTCHVNFGAPQNDQAYGHWTGGAQELFKAKKDDMDALACAACHGPVHALYPAQNPYGKNRDNMQPLAYQKLAMPLGARKNCAVCHTKDMDTPAHHAGMGL